MQNKIKEKLSTLPLCPGVYIMKDMDNNIIYVGKSKLLKNRVSQYFQNSATHSPKTVAMVAQIADFEYIVTDTEAEALALECNLIKKHRPKYNILLKDDKQYPYIKITSEDFPRIFMTRQLKKDGSLYLGPFISASNVKEAIEEIRKLFRIRNCSQNISKNQPNRRFCLYHQIGECSAPCCGKISKTEYQQSLKAAISVLNGNQQNIITELQSKMLEASQNLEFEKAAQIRDKIVRINALSEKQNISSTADGNMDFVGIYREGESFCIQVFYYRNGNAVGSEYFTFENEHRAETYVLESFVKQFYFTQSFIPKEIYLSAEIEDKATIETWLSQTCGHKVSFYVPQKGKKADIIKMVVKNAQESLYKVRMLKSRSESYQNRILVQLKELLNLEKVPSRIEAYDISNFSGASSLGVQIVYQNALPVKRLYRKYNIKTVEGMNDYESMREVISRRINEAYKEEELVKVGTLDKNKAKFLPLPDLILLDGGKGHVSAVQILLDTFGEEIPLFGLVKNDYHKTHAITDAKNEFLLDKNSELFKFLACMQDEVHRYAITACRSRHENLNTKSQLEKISGVGPSTRKKLLLHFGGLKNIKTAGLEDLKAVVNEKTANAIIEFFKSKKQGEISNGRNSR